MDNIINKIKELKDNSMCEIIIHAKSLKNGQYECEELNIPKDSVLSSIVMNFNCIYVDNWIRILGQGNSEHNGIMYYNTLIEDNYLYGMFIVAYDIVGGIYAINISRFNTEKNMIWYFAPDTLEWESLNMNYWNFIVWAMQGNIDEFYETMRWKNWKDDCKNVKPNMCYLVYPFLWSKEYDENTADRKIVPFDEVMKLNFDYCKKIQF